MVKDKFFLLALPMVVFKGIYFKFWSLQIAYDVKYGFQNGGFSVW